jgi:uncharacterized protein YndB with AHSA1/START domain
MLLTIILIAVAALLALLLLLAARKPDTFVVQRSAEIAAPPEKIFPLINDFRRWQSWSPYEKLDPAMKRTLRGAPEGKGALYAWESKGRAGVGEMEITDSMSPARVALALRFTKPFQCNNRVLFTLDRENAATRVTWRMEGPASFVHKLMHVVFNMDRMVGRDFEAGLASLKTATES